MYEIVDCEKCPIWRHCWDDYVDITSDSGNEVANCPLINAIEAISHTHSVSGYMGVSSGHLEEVPR